MNDWMPLTEKEAKTLRRAQARLAEMKDRAIMEDSQQSGMFHARADAALDAIGDLLITAKVWCESPVAGAALDEPYTKAKP